MWTEEVVKERCCDSSSSGYSSGSSSVLDVDLGVMKVEERDKDEGNFIELHHPSLSPSGQHSGVLDCEFEDDEVGHQVCGSVLEEVSVTMIQEAVDEGNFTTTSTTHQHREDVTWFDREEEVAGSYEDRSCDSSHEQQQKMDSMDFENLKISKGTGTKLGFVPSDGRAKNPNPFFGVPGL